MKDSTESSLVCVKLQMTTVSATATVAHCCSKHQVSQSQSSYASCFCKHSEQARRQGEGFEG